MIMDGENNENDYQASVALSKTKVKVDLAYLLEKYGPKKKRITKHVEQEPKYYDKGFSVKFKLSHAFKALEKQEQTVAEPKLEEKPKLSARAIRRLAKANPVVTPQPTVDKNRSTSEKDRLEADLDKYRKIGQRKLQQCDRIVRSVRQQNNKQFLGENNLETNKPHRAVPLEFWRSLSKRKGREKDTVLVETDGYEDKTFITNVNVKSMLKPPRQQNKHKTTNNKHHVSFVSEHQTGQKRTAGRYKSASDGNPKGVQGTKAVQEWEKRKQNRKQKKIDQNFKIKQSQQNGKGNDHKHAGASSGSIQDSQSKVESVNSCDKFPPKMRKRRANRKIRPKSAPNSTGNERGILHALISGHYTYPSSEWTKSLDKVYLDVPDKFEEPSLGANLVKKMEKTEGSIVGSGDEEGGEEKDEPELQYRPSKYLYDMCHCQQVSKLRTLKKLEKSSDPAGVIEIYGCSEDSNTNFSCPFCSVFPNKRIQAWIEDVELQMSI